MKQQMKKNTMSSMAPLLLFVIFTLCIISVLFTGADTYQTFTRKDQESYQQRTIVQYLTTRLRQSDVADMYFVGDFQDPTPKSEGNTLYLQETYGERTFYTRIYAYDGYLRELFAASDIVFQENAGEKLLVVENVNFTIQEDCLSISIEYVDHSTESVVIHMRSGKELSQ